VVEACEWSGVEVVFEDGSLYRLKKKGLKTRIWISDITVLVTQTRKTLSVSGIFI